MHSRGKLWISLAVPSIAVIILALLWRRKTKDTPCPQEDNTCNDKCEELQSKDVFNASESLLNEQQEHLPNQSQIDNIDKVCEVEDSDIHDEQVNEPVKHKEHEREEEVLLDNQEDYKNEEEYLKQFEESKIISHNERVGKKTSCCTIDSGVELTKQPSFDLKDWLEETQSEGSGDSNAFSSFAEPQMERFFANACDVPESEKMVWEIEFPQILCGRLIGRKGKNVKVISDSSGAKIRLIPQSPGEVSTHRIISISGDSGQVKAALDTIHERFPAVPLSRINATATPTQNVITSNVVPVASPLPYVQTVLPNIANFNVVVTSVLDGNHFFIQLQNDGLQAQLQQLHQTMLQCYGQGSGGALALALPHPIIVGAYCAAPAFTYDGWYRAQVLGPTGNGDEVQVKYLDYGGYGRIASSSLRQLRSDFLSYLPYQAVECYLANVAPLNTEGFSLVSSAVLEDLTMNSVLTARVVGHRNQLPCLELYLVQGQQTIMINRELVNRGLARWVET